MTLIELARSRRIAALASLNKDADNVVSLAGRRRIARKPAAVVAFSSNRNNVEILRAA